MAVHELRGKAHLVTHLVRVRVRLRLRVRVRVRVEQGVVSSR